MSQEEANHWVHGCCLEADQGVWVGLAAGRGAPSWEFAGPPCPWKHSGANLSAGGLLQCLATLLLDQAFVENRASLVQKDMCRALVFPMATGNLFPVCLREGGHGDNSHSGRRGTNVT